MVEKAIRESHLAVVGEQVTALTEARDRLAVSIDAAAQRIGQIRAMGVGWIAALALVGGIVGGTATGLVTAWLIVSAIDREFDGLQAAID